MIDDGNGCFIEKSHNQTITLNLGTFSGTSFFAFFRRGMIDAKRIKAFHIFSLQCVHNFYIRLHSLIVSVARPLHYYCRRNTEPEGINYKSPSPGVGSQYFMFRNYGLGTFRAAEGNDTNRRIKAGSFGGFVKVAVHSLITKHRKRGIVRQFKRGVFVKD